ncbi:chorismate mutase/prephenate dehydratase [Exophiala viscosa]|uniref:chorismate mutase/prephenate dehydratase n=1 Tax=Exophiala viscosa TaxID=2486360 RepID=UPI002197A07B|nr:chorismate mutase/prephenate dehydratase [Exophiala viscosa]
MRTSLHFAGPEASFSHQAAIEVFSPSTNTLHPLPSFSAIFSAIQISTHDFAVIPIENSTNGSVVQVLDLLSQCGLDSSAQFPDIEVVAEYYLPVHHCLFVAQNSDSSSKEIRTIYTHPQVWGQCNRYLSAHFPPNQVERIDVGSTSAAAQLVSRETNGSNAAIASKLAGQRHNLVCLAENIEDEPGSNTTRFFVVRNRNSKHPRTTGLEQYLSSRTGQNQRYKSLITFTIPHTKPGALADALAVFKQYHFNLTSIDTRPSRKRNWQYVFFVECEEADNGATRGIHAEEGNLQRLLADLQRFTESLQHLGRFQDQLQREDGIQSKT